MQWPITPQILQSLVLSNPACHEFVYLFSIIQSTNSIHPILAQIKLNQAFQINSLQPLYLRTLCQIYLKYKCIYLKIKVLQPTHTHTIYTYNTLNVCVLKACENNFEAVNSCHVIGLWSVTEQIISNPCVLIRTVY